MKIVQRFEDWHANFPVFVKSKQKNLVCVGTKSHLQEYSTYMFLILKLYRRIDLKPKLNTHPKYLTTNTI